MKHWRKWMAAATLSAAVAAGGCASQRDAVLVAHRGESAEFPENTLVAFGEGWRRGAYAVELDVHRTKDGVWLCMHDDNFKRTGGKEVKVSELTFDETQSIDVGRWKGPQFIGIHAPALAEALDAMPDDSGRIYLEIKDKNKNFAADLKKLVKQYDIKQNQLIIITFYDTELAAFNREYPGFRNNLLVSGKNLLADPAKYLKLVREIGATGISVGIGKDLTPELVKLFHDQKLEFHVWTIDDVEVAKHVQSCGVDSITSNRPSFLRDHAFTKKAAAPSEVAP